jgi:methylated-DNA-[protein]-cysteine S-methyltransferase
MTTKTTKDLYYSAWATAWGPMGAVMGEAGLRRIVLPHYPLQDLLALLAWEHPGTVKDDKPFDALTALTRDYFNGKGVDFSEVLCDLPGEGTLGGLVLRACRKIPYGRTLSYHALAETIRRPDAARAVAGAMGKNGIPLVVPCHRVTYADGRLGGFSAPGGVDVKKRMLDLERRGS